MGEKKLKNTEQIYVVMQLAMFERATDVKDSLKEIFGVDISLPAILHYDITNPQFPEKWEKLFTETRENYIEDTSSIAISHKSVRLREIQKMFEYEKTQRVPNKKIMRELLEQAAKEAGNAYTNKVNVEGVVDYRVSLSKFLGCEPDELPAPIKK
jgi:hypothetical protein